MENRLKNSSFILNVAVDQWAPIISDSKSNMLNWNQEQKVRILKPSSNLFREQNYYSKPKFSFFQF